MTEITALKQKFKELQSTLCSYSHALGVLSYDAATAAPDESYRGRGETMATLTRVEYELSTCEETRRLLLELNERREELTREEARAVEVMLEEYNRTSAIPKDEYVAFTVLCNEAEAVWHRAKPANDFASFAPYLEKIVAYTRSFALYYKPDADPYETLVAEYEDDITLAEIDGFFAVLRRELVPLIKKIGECEPPDDSFLKGEFPVWKQRKLSKYLMGVMGMPADRCAIGETEHPFTTSFNSDDARITTHYYPDNFASSMYSVIHEGGHALYELCADKSLWRTVLETGTSMGIHESQSRLYENIIGRSREFVSLILPKLTELFPQLEYVSADMLYKAINKVNPSLIRVEADELTYCMHIMIRYELEKGLISGEIPVSELPKRWNELYMDYLGVAVPDDTRGVLQDSHWSSALFGYFPSYALGSAYGAQMLASMQKDVDVYGCVARGELAPITEWLTEKIYKHQKLLKPAEVIMNACGAPFNPTYYTEYLKAKYTALYNL